VTQKKLTFTVYGLAVLIGAALLYVRFISDEFVLGTDTFSHPYKSFVAMLIFAGLVWMCLIPLFKHLKKPLGKTLWAFVFLGIVFRAMFLGSTPIYEDDWNRYLWDGAVTAQGINPYTFPPDATFAVHYNASDDLKELQVL